MVARGQFLERPTLIPVGKTILEGLWHRGEAFPPLLIIPSRPADGGGMDQVVSNELAWALATSGHPTLRFNFRGVGASQGERGGDEDLVADARAALRVLVESAGSASAAIASIGTGARIALALADRRSSVERLCLVGPEGIALEELLRVRVPLCVFGAEEDQALARAPLAAALLEAGAHLEVIEGADRPFTQNLPQLGKAVVRWVTGAIDPPTPNRLPTRS